MVVVFFLAAGGYGLYRDGQSRQPVDRAVPGSPAARSAREAAHPVPADHPRIELPPEVTDFLADLAAEAEASAASVDLWQRLARARYRAGLLNDKYLAGALAALNHLMELDPDNREGIRMMGNIAYDQRRYADAQRHFSRFLKLEPDDPRVMTDLASSLLFQEKKAEAESLYRRAIAAKPDFLQAHFNLGIILQAQGKSGEALDSLKRALALATTVEQTRQINAVIAQAEGREPEAAANGEGQQ